MSFGKHTSKQIIGSKGDILKEKKIVICITGSVASIKSPEIARGLMRLGAEVFTVMTPMAQKIIHPYIMEWSTGNPVITELTGKIEHVTLGGDHSNKADLILVAPSTANTIGKAAAAIDDTPVTTLLTTAIGAGIPIVIAPAMHMSMYKHPIVIENIRKLREIGINILIPRIEEEKAKIPNTDDIIQAVVDELSQQRDFEGYNILITAGPTREYIDGFRFISNPSSGKTGVEIANEALKRGARVTMIYGPGSESPPIGADIVNIISTEEMLNAVKDALKENNYDIAILSAAASDYAPEVREMIKTPSRKKEWTIKLRSLPKIIEHVKDIDPEIFLVGFKAEFNVSDEILIERAKKTMNLSDMDIIVANDVARENRGFATATNEVYIIDKEGSVEHVPLTGKKVIAKTLFKTIKDKLELK